MKHHLFFLLGAVAVLGCSSNSEQPPPTRPAIAKENAVEYILKTKRLPDGRVVFQLNRTYYVNSKQSLPYVFSDTLPGLGKEYVDYTEDEDADEQQSVSKLVDKDYDVLFKVDSLKE